MHFSNLILASVALASALASNLTNTSLVERQAAPSNPPRNLVYVQTFRRVDGGNFSMLPMIQRPTQVTHIYISALHINSDPAAITLNDHSPNDTMWNNMWREARQLQRRGVKVMYMMGGAAPGSYPRLCGGRNGAINEAYYMPLMRELRFRRVDGIDLDIEERVPGSCPLALLRRLNRDFGNNFITTMSPVASELQPSGVGLGGFSYKTLDRMATNSGKPNGKLVNWYNPQFYNGWGDSSTPNGYNAIVNNGYPANRVVFNTLTSQFNGGSGWFALRTYQNVINTLKANYGNQFGGSNGWEYWDAGRSDNLREPFQWMGRIGNSVFGTNNQLKRDDAAVKQDFNDTITFGDCPWPGVIEKMWGMGVARLKGVQALNETHGDTRKAMGRLGLGGRMDELMSSLNLTMPTSY